MQKRKDGVIMNRKFLAKVLAASLVLTATPALPGAEADAASQKTGGGYLSLVKSNRGAGIETDITCGGFLSAHTTGIEVTETGIGVTFKNISDADATSNWNTPVFVIYTGDEPVVKGTGYTEYGIMRSDNYGLQGEHKTGTTKWESNNVPANDEEWATWLDANKAGADYKVSAIRKENTVFMKISAGNIVVYGAVPVAEGKTAYLSLSGEKCKLTEISDVAGYESFEIPAGLADVAPDKTEPDNPGTDNPGTDEPGTDKPGTDNPGTDKPGTDNPGTDKPGDTENSVTFEGFWTKFLDGEKITEDGITLKFKAKSNGSLRFEVPVYAVFSSDDGKVGNVGLAPGAEPTNGYTEYGVMRSDYNGWNGVKYWGQGATTYNPTAAETEEAVKDWTPTQKEFNDYIVEAYKEGTNVYMKITAGTLVTFAKFTVPAEKDVYLALTGENCTVENYTCSATENKFTDANEPADIVLGPDKLDCKDYRVAFSGGNEITSDGVAVTFNSKTYADANFNWNSPALVVYEAEVPSEHNVSDTVFKATAGYSELLYARADNWGYALGNDNDEYRINCPKWSEEGYNWVARGLPNWDLFREANKAGVPCEASAVYKDGKILVKLSVNGVTNLISFPYEKKEGKNVYFSLTGEMCTLSDIATSTFTGITIPSGIATYPVILPTPTPAPTLPPAGEDNSEGVELDCEGWWTAHTSGIEVTSGGVALTFKNNTYSAAANQWEVPVVVAYAGDEAKVNGAGYDEYAVIRGDAYAWTTKAADANTGAGLAAWNNLGYTFQSNASTFDTWLADNKAGTNCKVQAVKKDGKVIIETTVGSVTSYTTFPVDAGKKVYISLSGEKCKLTNIKTAQYTAINVPGGTPSVTATPAPSADPSATPAPGATATPGTDKPGTPDPGTTANPGTQTPGTTETPEEPSKEDNKKKTMKVSGITAKAGKKKVTGTVSVKAAKVKVKVGNKNYKNAKVNGKKFTFTTSSKLKKGTKITIKVTKTGYKTVTKSVKVK